MPVPWQLSQTTTPRPSHVMHTFSVACAGWLRVENRLAVHERVFSALYQTLGLASSTPQKWQEPRLNRRHEHELDLWADPQGADLQLGAFDASTLLALGTTYTSLRHRLEGHSHSFTNLDRVRLEDLLIHDHLLGPARPILRAAPRHTHHCAMQAAAALRQPSPWAVAACPSWADPERRITSTARKCTRRRAARAWQPLFVVSSLPRVEGFARGGAWSASSPTVDHNLIGQFVHQSGSSPELVLNERN